MEQALVVRRNLIPATLEEVNSIAKDFYNSGLFKDVKDAAQLRVKIMAGREMGFPPFVSVQGVDIIDGKPTLGGDLMAAAMKREGYYWRIPEWSNKGCKLIVFYKGKELGLIEFDVEDAKRAGVVGKWNWAHYTKMMFFWRCISIAARVYASEIFLGATVYLPEELGRNDEPPAIPEEFMDVEAKVIEPEIVEPPTSPKPDLSELLKRMKKK